MQKPIPFVTYGLPWIQGVVECYKKPKRYKDFLMLSEWLVDVPEDFAEKYYAVPCPVGKRVLVVSGNVSSYLC